MKKHCGFTLAEVLLVLGIIGIVAALAIPPVYKNVTNDRMKAKANKALASISNAVSLRHALTSITPEMYATACENVNKCPKGGALSGYLLIDSKTTGVLDLITDTNAIAWNKPALKIIDNFKTDGSNTVCELADGAIVSFPNSGIRGCITSANGCSILVDTNGVGGPSVTKIGKAPKDVSTSTNNAEPDLIQLIVKDSRVAPANKRTRNILSTGDATKPETLP